MAAGDNEDYELRFFAQQPHASNAQAAATRVYERNGVLVRSDPFLAPLDRKGQPFKQTMWHDPESETKYAARPMEVTQAPQTPADPVTRFREKILQRMGSSGIHALGRIFRIMDDDGNNRLNEEELRTGLNDYQLHMSHEELQELIQKIGKGRPITYDEMLLAVRGVLSQRRLQMIDVAYKALDTNGNGSVTVDDIAPRFGAWHYPDVLTGRLPAEEAMEHFLSNFDGVNRDGIITKQEFIEYYKNVSASIDDDDYFELMMRNAWHIPGGEGWCANTSNVRLLVVHTNGKQEVVMIMNDLGLDVHNNEAVMKQLTAQGIKNVAKFSLSGDV